MRKVATTCRPSTETSPKCPFEISYRRLPSQTSRVGDEPKQSGDLSELIWPVPALISILSRTFRLLPGDLIFTGTPAGVGPLARGDRVTGGVEGVGTVEIEIV